MKRLLFLLVALSLQAQSLLTISKTSYEEFNCSVDFVQAIGTDGMTLVSVTAATLAGADSTAAVIATAPVPAVTSSTKVVFRVQGGRNGETHRLSVKVTDATTGEKFEGVMMLHIQN